MPQQNILRIAVAGGAGFVGSHLCDKLIDAGHTVVCIDNLITGRDTNIQHLRQHPRFNYVHADISRSLPRLGKIDALVNLASPASPRDYLRFPLETLKVGSLGTINTLDVAREFNAIYLLVSTSEVYGNPEVNPQPESYWGKVNSIGVRSVYTEAKRFAEAVSAAYLRKFDMDVRIARVFNAYGPRMRSNDGRAVPSFVTSALNDEPIRIFGDGSQTRSLCYVTDLADGLLKLLTVSVETLLSSNEGQTISVPVVNIGNPDEVTILELANQIIAIIGSSSTIELTSPVEDDPKVRCPDISLARSLLKWQPLISRDQGLMKTIEYFRLLDGVLTTKSRRRFTVSHTLAEPRYGAATRMPQNVTEKNSSSDPNFDG